MVSKLTFILVAGGNNTGKDTFCDRVMEFSKDNDNINVFKYNREDLAAECMLKCGWDGKKTPEYRNLLRDMTMLSEKTGKFFDYLKDNIISDLETGPLADDTFILLQVRDPSKITSTLSYVIPSIIEKFNDLKLQPMSSLLIKRTNIIDREMDIIEKQNDFDWTFKISDGIDSCHKAADTFLEILKNNNADD